MIDLQKFVSKDMQRSTIEKPWTRGGFTYATNGHIIVRVPARADVPEVMTAPDATKLKWGVVGESVPIPDLPEPTMEECGDCFAIEEDMKDCEECKGTGKVPKYHDVEVGGASFSAEYLALIKALPGYRFYPVKNDFSKVRYSANPSPFTFDGGEGLLMPLKA